MMNKNNLGKFKVSISAIEYGEVDMELDKKCPSLFAFEIKFIDGIKMIVHDLTFSRAKVQATYKRYLEGAETHKQLHVIDGVRRKEFDKYAI